MTKPVAPNAKPEKKPRSGKKAAPPKKVKLARRRAPILLELTYTLFVMVVIGTALSTAIISLLAGADLLMVVVRSGAALLSTGFIFWVVYWLMATGIIEVRRQQVIEEAVKQKDAAAKAQSTVNFEA